MSVSPDRLHALAKGTGFLASTLEKVIRLGEERLLSHITRERGYRVQWSREEHAGRKVSLGYTGADGAADRIEVDLSYLFRLPLEEVKEMRMWQPGEMVRPRGGVVQALDQDQKSGK